MLRNFEHRSNLAESAKTNKTVDNLLRMVSNRIKILLVPKGLMTILNRLQK